MNKIIFLISFLALCNLQAQNSLKWLKIQKYRVAVLPDSLKETSGLAFWQDKLITVNDGGNSSEIFEIDKKSGKILSKTKTSLKNFDWEAVATDSATVYVGDFGNNWGSRKDLKIYRFNNNLSSDSITFYYPEQKDFTAKPQLNDWDAESMFYRSGKLHIFNKQWVSGKTFHYEVDANNVDNQAAKKLEEFDLGYLATDVSYFQKRLYLIGYTKKMEVYLTVFEEDENGLFFSKKPQKYYLGQSSKLGQFEGIAVNPEGIFISAEEFDFKIFHAAPALYFIPRQEFGY